MPLGGVEEEELEMDEESGRQMEMHTLNQLNSLLKPDRRAPKRPMPCGLGHSPHVESNGGMDGIEFNMRLIQQVRDRAYLYDVMAEAYNNPTWRISAWNEVGMSLECSAEQVKTRWKTLRDKFKKEDKKVRSGESSNWMYFEPMEFLQPHLRDKSFITQQHHDMFARSSSSSQVDGKQWRMEEQSMMKEMEEGPPPEKKPAHLRMEDCAEEAVQQQQQQQQPGSIMVDTDEISATGVEERDERAATSASGDYHRDMLLRMGNRHYAPQPHHSQHSSPATDEDEVFGHMIALRLAKMEPRFKESVKVKLMQTLYDAQFGPDSPQSTVAPH
ncbi:madf-9 [Pristionchus pacificus]|uniref:Madf-9 n=1 Tax=Pristionchus pacificus TaxID=54126 RepID=A0A2A6BY63_PRIPA|nr:madf-9 [Pristionchus pacificus]|eukprot:PDM70850.1 madf-9 [Pristionchus pacificus]